MGQNEERQKRWTFWLREVRGYSVEVIGCSRQVHELRACHEKSNIARVAATFREFGPICAQMPEIWGRLNPPLTA
jgi:hypothetical protein